MSARRLWPSSARVTSYVDCRQGSTSALVQWLTQMNRLAICGYDEAPTNNEQPWEAD